MTRSFGDGLAKSIGVIAVPDIFTHQITQNDSIIVIASDGLWEFMTNDEVIFFHLS